MNNTDEIVSVGMVKIRHVFMSGLSAARLHGELNSRLRKKIKTTGK